MAGTLCPFCQHTIALTYSTLKVFNLDFDGSYSNVNESNLHSFPYLINVVYVKCPNCEENHIHILGKGEKVNYINTPLHPNSTAKQYPNYIPEQILNDYKEACAIVNLSPKASATLSRRCLQGMIQDFWKIKKNRLVDAIKALEEKVSPSQWKAIDTLRKIGNIGAHMEKDVNLIVDIEPSEAEKLIKLIELLIDKWYIARHDEELLLQDIVDTGVAKQNQKNGS